MEGLEKRYKAVVSTLGTLQKALVDIENPAHSTVYANMRDSVIQRFEFSIDTMWKFLKVYLQEKRNVSIQDTSPRAIFRQALAANLMSEQEFKVLIKCVEDRNLTSHTYNEDLAEDILGRIPGYYLVMKNLIDKMEI